MVPKWSGFHGKVPKLSSNHQIVPKNVHLITGWAQLFLAAINRRVKHMFAKGAETVSQSRESTEIVV